MQKHLSFVRNLQAVSMYGPFQIAFTATNFLPFLSFPSSSLPHDWLNNKLSATAWCKMGCNPKWEEKEVLLQENK